MHGADGATDRGTLRLTGRWEALCEGEAKDALETLLRDALPTRRWFGGKARRIRSVTVTDAVPISTSRTRAFVLLTRVAYEEGGSERYQIPLAAAFGDAAARLAAESSAAVIGRLLANPDDDRGDGVLYDALWNPDVTRTLLEAIGRGRRFAGTAGEMIATSTHAFADLGAIDALPAPAVMQAEQSNTSVRYGERVILKLYRRLEDGINPDLEIGRHLTERRFPHVPPILGAIEYRRGTGEPATLAVLQGFVPNQGDAWRYTLDSLRAYFARERAASANFADTAEPEDLLSALLDGTVPQQAEARLGSYLDSAGLLGRRTAELHAALASSPHPDFAPEPVPPEYLRERCESIARSASRVFDLLRRRWPDLPDETRREAGDVLDREENLSRRLETWRGLKPDAFRIRCHGDYHLGQVLYTGRDFVIIDFEGEPARPLSERRAKHVPLLDVAGMLRSFHYAASAVLFEQRAQTDGLNERSAGDWYRWVCTAFLRTYREAAGTTVCRFASKAQTEELLRLYLVEKALYELGYELNNRPDWVRIPLRGLRHLLQRAD
ncbi:MAG: putative maltokinase [Nitrospirota bacterium]